LIVKERDKTKEAMSREKTIVSWWAGEGEDATMRRRTVCFEQEKYQNRHCEHCEAISLLR